MKFYQPSLTTPRAVRAEIRALKSLAKQARAVGDNMQAKGYRWAAEALSARLASAEFRNIA